MLETSTLFYAALFLSVLLLVEGLFMLFGGRRERKAVNRRMLMRTKGMGSDKVMETLRRRRPGERAPDGIWGRLDGLIANSGLRTTPARQVLVMAALAAVVALLLIAFVHLPVVIAAPIGIVSGIVLPVVSLKVAAAARIKKFNAQLPDALDMIVRSLRAGHPTTAALKLVAEQMADPIGSEFGLVTDEMTYGLEMREALESMCARVRSTELNFMVASMRLQSQAGGNLTEVLGSLARVIRERSRFSLKVRAISAQGRFAAWTISSLPFLVFGIISVLNPKYFGDVWTEPGFIKSIIVAGVLLTIGVAVIIRLVNFRY